MNKRTKLVTRIVCLFLAIAMVATIAYTVVASILLG